MASLSARALLLPCLMVCLWVSAAAPAADGPAGTLVCVGDSITAGEAVTAEQCYVGRLRAKGAAGGLTVVSDGRSGWTTGAFVQNAEAVVAKVPADATVVTIVLGTNDAHSTEPAGRVAGAAARNVERLIGLYRAKAPGAAFVICSPPAVSPDRLSPRLRRAGYDERTPVNLAAISGAYRTLAGRMGVRFVDLSALPSAGHTVDGVHPNADGHAELADAIWVGLSARPLAPLPSTRP